jgi:hypothetical protein
MVFGGFRSIAQKGVGSFLAFPYSCAWSQASLTRTDVKYRFVDRLVLRHAEISKCSEGSPMTNDVAAQLVILTEALTQIVDLTTLRSKPVAQPADLLDHMSEIAAGALIAAATYGQLPPFPSEISRPSETLN